jgi:hypothetical protein
MALCCAPFPITKYWLSEVIFKGKWEMRFIDRTKKCFRRVSERKEGDDIMLCAGPYWCYFRITKVHRGWHRISHALHTLWKHIAPSSSSAIDAITRLWRSLDTKGEFKSACDWDTHFAEKTIEVVVWEGNCTRAFYQGKTYNFVQRTLATRTPIVRSCYSCMQLCIVQVIVKMQVVVTRGKKE